MTWRAFFLAVIMFASTGLLYGQEGYLHLRVTNIQGQPIKGVRLIPVTSPRMPSKPTSVDGRTQILITRYQVGKGIALELFDAPKNMILFPPIPPVPPSRCKAVMTTPPEPADIILVTKAQKTLLESSRAITIIVSSLLENTLKSSFRKGVAAEPRLSSLLELAVLLELEPTDIEKAIRKLSQNSTDTYEKGLLALYEQDYRGATEELSRFLGERIGNNGQKNLRVLNASYSDPQQDDHGESSTALQNSTAVELDAAFFLGQAFYEQGKYRDASDTYQKLASLRPDDPTIFASLAMALYGTGKYQEAIIHSEKALLLSEREGDHGLKVTILNILGGIYMDLGQYRRALDIFNRSISLSRKITDLKGEGRSLMNMGVIYRELGEISQALAYFNRSLVISRGSYDKELELLTLNAIGVTSFDLLEYEKAISYLMQALRASEQLNDEAAEGVILLDLGHVYLNVGRYAEAGEFFRRSIQIQMTIFGRDHPNVASGLEGLGLLYTKQGKYDEAEELFTQVLHIRELILGADHPAVVTTLDRLASLYSQQGRYSKAESLYKRALVITEKILGREQTELVSLLKALAGVYYKQERYAEGEALIKRALSIMESTRPNEVDLIPLLENYELLLRKSSRGAEAARIRNRIDSIRAKSIRKNAKPRI